MWTISQICPVSHKITIIMSRRRCMYQYFCVQMMYVSGDFCPEVFVVRRFFVHKNHKYWQVLSVIMIIVSTFDCHQGFCPSS